MGNWYSSAHVKLEVEHTLHVKQLQSEIEALKKDNDILRHEILRTINSNNTVNRDASVVSTVSVARIDEIVQKLLDDPNTNLSFVPDAIERHMSRNSLLFVLTALARATDSAKIELLGHEWTLTMRPIPVTEESSSKPDKPTNNREIGDQFDESVAIVPRV